MIIEDFHIRRAQDGDPVSQEIVLAAASSFLQDFIGTHISSVADADDVTQDALLAVNKALYKYHGGSFKDWLAKIAWNFINNYNGGEYECGKRRGPVGEGKIPYAYREMPLSEVAGGLDFDEIEGEINPDHIIS